MKCLRQEEGFSLVEMMIVIAVVSVLVTISFVQINTLAPQAQYSMMERIFRADINMVISWSQVGKIEQTTDAVPTGYGIQYTVGSPEYIVYAEFDGNQKYDGTGRDIVVRTLNIESDEFIADAVFGDCTPLNLSGNTCDFFVEMWSGIVYVEGGLTDDLRIELRSDKYGYTRTYIVHVETGFIDPYD